MATEQILDLRNADLRSRTADVVEREGRSNTVFGTYFFAHDDPDSVLPRRLEQSVFDEAFGNSPELLAAEYGPYEANSIFVCVIDHRRSIPVGALRILLPGGPLKSLDDVERFWEVPLDEVLTETGIEIDLTTTWDVATLAVDAGYRDGLISSALFQGLGTASAIAEVGWYVSILDVLALRLVQNRTRRVFSRYAGIAPMRYLDSVSSLPVYSDLLPYRHRLRETDRETYELLFEAQHLEPVLSFPASEDIGELVVDVTDRAVRSSLVNAQAG
jgi:hypothetical protein